MEEFSYELKIPKERVAVLIGKDGSIKNELESQMNAKINIDSKEGDVKLTSSNSVNLYILKDIIKAIGRGFNPEVAMQLLKPDFVLELLSMADYVKSPNQMLRLKGRVIGKGGKARETVEEFTDTNISVYGKTIAIVGFCDNVAICKKAVESLLSGSPHSAVYKWLEKHQKASKMADMAGF